MPDIVERWQAPIRIGISSCLMGEEVRFDGGHKHDGYLTQTLGEYFEFVPVCPEVEIGLSTPRESIRLVQIDEKTCMVGSKTGHDLTAQMTDYAERRAKQLVAQQLSGYILKRASPSCGMERVKVYLPRGPAKRSGVGLFAAALMDRFPNLPVEEEGRLCDPRLRENWIARVFAFHAIQELWSRRWKLVDLVDFHTRYKFVVLAHSEKQYRELGRLVANAKKTPRAELKQTYEAAFMSALKKVATTRKNTNVLQHMLGFLKKELTPPQRRDLAANVDDYLAGFIPLIVPLTLIRHYVQLLDVIYLQEQVYLNPHPKELALRNHV
jgi:uncharacterized protein YbgA (DUF1722 family)/uncharacterized protein YbbK (DUF523 family)